MKTKKYLFTGVLVILVLSSTAQVKFGIKEGINLTTQSEIGMLWDNNDIKTGFTLGATFDYQFHSIFSIQTELNYKTTGSAYEVNESSVKQNITKNYDYYNIPVLVKTRFTEELGLPETWTVSFYTGPYYSYLKTAETEVKENGTTTVNDYAKESNDSDWGLVLGGEVAKSFTKGELFFDLRYEMGLNDVTTNETIKNKVIGLGFGYRF